MNYQQRFGQYQLQPYGNSGLLPQQYLPPPIPQVVAPGATSQPEPAKPMQNPFAANNPWMNMQGERGGIRSAADARDLARSGVMDASMSNLGNLGRIGLGFMGGPMGLGMLGLQTGLSQLGIGSNPFNFEGFSKIDADLLAGITSDNPNIARGQLARARQMQAERNAKNAAKGRGLGFGGNFGSSGGEGYAGGNDLSRDPTPGTAGR